MTDLSIHDCRGRVEREFVRRWQGDLPETDGSRLCGPLVPIVMSTKTSPEVDLRRQWMAIDWLCRVHFPAWLDLAGMTEHATAVRALAELHDKDSAFNAQATIGAASDAAYDKARAVAGPTSADEGKDAAWADVDAAGGDVSRAVSYELREGVARAARGGSQHAARSVAKELRPAVVAMLQASAADLVRRMVEDAP